MFSKILILGLAASSLVAAHGNVQLVQGDAGGNGTALGIKGGVVPKTGPNSKTEVDTTVFGNTNIMTDGLGRTQGGGQNKATAIKQVMALSGPELPQVSSSLKGTFHIVTTDGAGPIKAVVDPTGTGKFSQGVLLKTTTQVPGKGGNIRPTQGKNKDTRSFMRRALESAGVITKRAVNVNEDYPMEFAVPAGLTCTGTVGGVQNVCLVKIANNNAAGPFGGVVPIQIVPGGNGTTTPATPATGAATGAAAGANAAAAGTAGNKAAKGPKGGAAARRAAAAEAVEFEA